jgi:beta-galactosidase
LNIAQPALTKKDVTIALPPIQKEAGQEYFLNIYAYTKTATTMIPAGHEIAREQFALAINDYFTANQPSSPATIEVLKDDNRTIVLKAGETVVAFNKQNGNLDNYSYQNKHLLWSGPQPDFWRAPTDNDFGNRMPELANVWKQAGQNKTMNKLEVNKSTNSAVITVNYTLNDVSSPYTLKYTFTNEGALKVQASWQAGKDNLPELPRFGTQLQLSPEFETVTYYGRGPWENYSDRNTSSFVGIYSSAVSEQSFDYVRPQENGNHTDVRWITLTNKDGLGIKITGAQPLSVKAARNPANDLDFGVPKKNAHPSDVTPRKTIYLNIDLLQRGVGGDDSWGRLPHKPYRLLNDKYEYEYEISAL